VPELRVLVTRPAHQNQALVDLLMTQGVHPLTLPVIDIIALPQSVQLQTMVEQRHSFHLAIFISPNAVAYGLALLLAYGSLPNTLKLVTIGQASADKVKQILGHNADIYPHEDYNSEALLALDALQPLHVNNKKIIIFRGQGGRELLANTLRQRGAEVVYAEVYQRKIASPSAELLATLWTTNQNPHIIIVTSDQGLRNLVTIHSVKPSYLTQLWQTPLVVVTEKMRKNAQYLGFTHTIIVATEVSNEALVRAVNQWVSSMN
jgi:uroporphyrinogen-III synthase